LYNKEIKAMAVKIGSARIDENGKVVFIC